MTNIKFSFRGLLLALSAMWLLADTLMPDPFSYFSFRTVFVQYTGVIAIGVMSVAMMLALRPNLIERSPLHHCLGVGSKGTQADVHRRGTGRLDV